MSTIAWLGALEIAAGFTLQQWGDPLEKSKMVLVADQNLGWRQKANFSGMFQGKKLRTNELGLRSRPLADIGKDAKTVLVLGPSSTFGWGLEEDQTYTAILRKLLENAHPESRINVINAGQIGYSSWQGLEFYKSYFHNSMKLDIIVIAYGVNDVDKFRFYFSSSLSDKTEFSVPKKRLEIFMQNWLYARSSVSLISRLRHVTSRMTGCYQKTMPVRRVDDADFMKNIEDLIRLGTSRGARVILLTSPYALPVSQGNDPDRERRLTEAYYYLSSAYCSLGNARDGRSMFEKARRREPTRIARDIEKLNNRLREKAIKDGVLLIDAERLVGTAAGNANFVDPIHLSAAGNKQIAAALFLEIFQHDILFKKK